MAHRYYTWDFPHVTPIFRSHYFHNVNSVILHFSYAVLWHINITSEGFLHFTHENSNKLSSYSLCGWFYLYKLNWSDMNMIDANNNSWTLFEIKDMFQVFFLLWNWKFHWKYYKSCFGLGMTNLRSMFDL